jgi:hypothetical protein
MACYVRSQIKILFTQFFQLLIIFIVSTLNRHLSALVHVRIMIDVSQYCLINF